MKILQVIPNFDFGGAETMCENLTCALRNLGHEVCVVSLYNKHTPISDRMEAQGIRILYLDKKLGLDLSMVPGLVRILRQEKPDVVHTHLDVVKYAALAAKLTGVKVSVHTVHNLAEKEAEGLARKINWLYYKLGWSKPVALSPEVRRTIAQVYGLNGERIPMVYNGSDLARCIPKGSYCLSEPVSLVHIGRFNAQKNHPGLFQAFADVLTVYPNSCLHLLGDGELRSEMEQLARQMGIMDRLCFHGTQADVYPFLAQADLFLLPSSYEGVPMTIIEAMGTGLPIVAAAVGGVPDMLRDGENALLVDADPKKVSQACITFLENEELRRRLGQQALKDSPRFSARGMAEKYLQVYGGECP